ncbi:OmpW/AlkL family protein [Porticoccus sp.]|nr:MAG: outer membrane protein OmpW [Gammaproteobacteria bacterium]
MKKQKALSLAINTVLAGSLLMGATAAMAYEPGDFIVRAGAANVDPNDDSDALKLDGATLPGTEVEVDDDTQLGITFTYMLTDHLGLGLLAATPFEHDIKADLTGIGAGKVDAGSTKHLPPTLTLQYFPMASDSKFQPYIGAGINYTNFFDEEVDSELETLLGHGSMELDASWGLAFQAGMDYMINEHWLINASVWYLDIDTDAKIDTAAGVVKTEVDIDPWVYMIGVGYKF